MQKLATECVFKGSNEQKVKGQKLLPKPRGWAQNQPLKNINKWGRRTWLMELVNETVRGRMPAHQSWPCHFPV